MGKRRAKQREEERRRQALPASTPTPAPPPLPPSSPPAPPEAYAGVAGPSLYQRLANLEAAALLTSRRPLLPAEAAAEAAAHTHALDKAQLLEVERNLTAYLIASIAGGSLKPSEAATLARAINQTIKTRRAVETAEAGEVRAAQNQQSLEAMRAAQIARINKELGKGRTFPASPEATGELSPEAAGPPTGFEL